MVTWSLQQIIWHHVTTCKLVWTILNFIWNLFLTSFLLNKKVSFLHSPCISNNYTECLKVKWRHCKSWNLVRNRELWIFDVSTFDLSLTLYSEPIFLIVSSIIVINIYLWITIVKKVIVLGPIYKKAITQLQIICLYKQNFNIFSTNIKLGLMH